MRLTSNLKHSIFSYKFLICVVTVAILCMFSEIPYENNNKIIIIEELLKFRTQNWLKNGMFFSNYAIALSFDNSIWFPIILPIISAFTSINIFSDEWNSSNYYICQPRYNKRKVYSFIKVINSSIISALVVIVGITLYIVVIYLIFPSINAYSGLIETDAFWGYIEHYEFIYHQGNSFGRLLVLAVKILNCGLMGFISPMISLILISLIKDTFLSLSIPMMINYLSYKLQSSIEWDKDNAYLLLSLPSSQYRTIFYIHIYSKSMFIPYLIGFILVYCILFILFNICIRRRYLNND